jgi:chromosome partitioning protein
MKVIAVANSKGGSGKTTTVFNLTGEISRRKQKVLALDMDPQASLTKAYKQEFPEDQIYLDDLLSTDKLDPTQAVFSIDEFLYLIPSTKDLEGCEYHLTKDAYRLRKIIQKLTNNYEYIFIDAPGTTDVFMGAVLSAADELIIPIRPSDFDLSALVDFKDKIEQVKKVVNPTLIIRGLLFNQVIKSSKNATHYRDLLKNHELGPNLLESEIRMSTAIQNSPSFGQDIGLKQPKSEAAKDFRTLADEVLSWQQ